MAEYGGFFLYAPGALRTEKARRRASGRCRRQYKVFRKRGMALGIPRFILFLSKTNAPDSMGWSAQG